MASPTRPTDEAVKERQAASGAAHPRQTKGVAPAPTSTGVRSVLRLQASAGNAAVTAMLHRRRPPVRRPGPSTGSHRGAAAGLARTSGATDSLTAASGGLGSLEVTEQPLAISDRRFEMIQREAAVAPPPAPPPTPIAPRDDPKFVAVTHTVEAKASKATAHPPAKAEVKQAQEAAVEPPDAQASKAAAAHSGKMATAKPGTFDKAAFIAAVKTAIAAAAPKNLDDADKFATSGKSDGVKADVMGKVKTGKDASKKDIADTTAAPPDPSGAAVKPVTPMPERQAAAPTDPNAARAMPSRAPAEQTNLGAEKAETDAAMAKEGVTQEQLEKSNEPQFQDAAKAKKEGEAHSENAPGPVREAEAQTLAQAKAGAAQKGTAAVGEMGAAKQAATAKVGGDKGATKGKDETERANVARDINGIFDETKLAVEKILTDLDKKVEDKFNEGEALAKKAFTEDHVRRMKEFKDKRYAGFDGAVQWSIDLFKDLPPEANQIFDKSRALYEERMTKVISDVADLIGSELEAATTRIEQGKNKIKAKVASLPKNLKQYGAEAAAAVQDKFGELTAAVDSKKEELVNDLAEKYVEAKGKVDEEITKLQAENKGLWSAAKEAVGGAIETIKKLKDMLLGVLARAAGAVDKIIQDPIAFLGNLVNAVKAGVMGFASRIGEHLKKGLQTWLFGALAAGGIELPEKFDLQGIIKLVLSLLGLTYANIRSRAVAILGEKVVAAMEGAVEIFKILVKDGPAGLWTFIKDKLGDLKEQVMSQIKQFVITKIVVAGITWLISLLNPASAFVKACKAIYDIVMFIVDKADQIKEFVDSVLDSVEAIAAGGAGKVAGLIENTLSKMVPVLIGFLASLLGLGGISEKIKSVLAAVQAPVNKAIDWVIKGALKIGKKLFGKSIAKGKALFAKGKAFVKKKIEAGKKWVKGKVAAGKKWVKGKIAAGKKWVKGKIAKGKAWVKGKVAKLKKKLGLDKKPPGKASPRDHPKIARAAASKVKSAARQEKDVSKLKKTSAGLAAAFGSQLEPGVKLKVNWKPSSDNVHVPFDIVIAPNDLVFPDEAEMKGIAGEIRAGMTGYGGKGKAMARGRVSITGYPGRTSIEVKSGKSGSTPRSDITGPPGHERHVLEPFAPGPGPERQPIPKFETEEERKAWLEARMVKKENVPEGEEIPGFWARVHDAENKILEEIAANVQKMLDGGKPVSGTIYVAANKEICPSCLESMHRFTGRFKGKITVVTM